MDPRILVNASLSSVSSLTYYEHARTLKDLLSLLIRASSPKWSPVFSFLISFWLSSEVWSFLRHSTSPFSMIKNSNPSSPSLNTNSFFSNVIETSPSTSFNFYYYSRLSNSLIWFKNPAWFVLFCMVDWMIICLNNTPSRTKVSHSSVAMIVADRLSL